MDQSEKKENPIAVRSKKWLTDSLLRLLEEKPYGNITIQDIADGAELVRQTFYKNFTTKDEVLNAHLAKLFRSYARGVCMDRSAGVQDLAQLFF